MTGKQHPKTVPSEPEPAGRPGSSGRVSALGRWFLKGSEEVSRTGALLCGYLLLFLSLIVGFEVVARKLFGFSLQGVDEIGGYVLAIVGTVGFSYTMLQRGHTRIDIFVVRFGQGTQRLLNVLAVISMAAFAVFMAWRGGAALFETLEYGSIANSPLATPLWIPQSIWFAGLVVFALTAFGLAILAVYLLVRRPEAVNSYFGVIENQEDAHEDARP
ncbi:MAG: TRAP transporter small permease subunit [Pseudomonadales bacterium]